MSGLASAPRPVRLAATLAWAAAAGALAAALHVPLPWMIGPLLATALGCMLGWPLQASVRLRNAGLWWLGTALGLYFTPPVLAVVARLAPAIALGVAWALLLGHGFYRFLVWTQGGAKQLDPTDHVSAYFAGAIGGASEMAILAERHHGRVDRVAAAHSLRVIIVVVLIPFALLALDVHGADLAAPITRQVDWPALAGLLAATAGGCALMWRLRTPNPWVLGALAVSAALAATGHAGSALPRGLLNAGQLAIGVMLGSRFTPAFMRAAPRWLGAVAVGTLGMIAVSAGFAWALAWALGLHPATLVLATSPGGIAEMAITASVLGLGVPVVTAFHVVRYVAVLVLTGPLWRRQARRLEAIRGAASSSSSP
ncbi:AbrB family transcriptional regulator [Ideonella sp. DXS22W]|uniref:AbrB family transcriptional regulator n=1 Tax=Pseudaquabacterium inlustre TaxID=2984192 RepID=A0ABU9CJA8_9BURK